MHHRLLRLPWSSLSIKSRSAAATSFDLGRHSKAFKRKIEQEDFFFCCLLIRFKRTLQVEEKDVTVYHLALVYLQMRKRSRQIGWHERESRPWWSRNNSGALCQLYTLCLWLSLSGLCLSVCAELIISGRSSGRDRRANWWRGKNPVSRCRRPMLKTSDLC